MKEYTFKEYERAFPDNYKDFIRINNSLGMLKIRAYTANEAIPISNLQIIVSTFIGNNKVIFFKGITDNSGMIEEIKLPAPNLSNDLEAPLYMIYNIEAKDINNKKVYEYQVRLYEGVCVIQNINIIPSKGGF